MPRDKDLKRLVRSRMKKTGESYTAARSKLVSTNNHKANDVTPSSSISSAPLTAHVVQRPPSVPAQDHGDVAGMSDVTIRQKTGHTWEEWLRIIDAEGGTELSHGARAALVNEKFEVDGWWSQCVAVGYERIRGLRARGQRMDGSWEASKSRTYSVPVEELFQAWSDDKTRKRWLGDPKAKVRTATAPRSLRLQLSDGAIIGVWFTAKGDAKSTAGVQHTKLPDKESSERVKEWWKEQLGALAAELEARSEKVAGRKSTAGRKATVKKATVKKATVKKATVKKATVKKVKTAKR